VSERVSERASAPVRPTLYARWLSPEGYLGIHLVVGFFVALVAGALFFQIADEVFEATATLAIDASAQQIARSIASPALTSFVLGITRIGNTEVITVLSIVVAVVLAVRHSRRRLYAFIATMAGGSLLNVVLKEYFRRARPFEDPTADVAALTTAHGYSFPSGHTMGSMLFFGSLAYVIYFSVEKHRRWRWPAVIICVLATLAIGLTRVYLGVHFLSDVVGGWIAALCWIAVCLTGTEGWVRWSNWRRSRNAVHEDEPDGSSSSS
jgi:undecaprenyl-diphosphatase